MTNGEKIQTILDIDKDCTEVYGKNGMMTFSVPQDWWNAEYNEPVIRDNGVKNELNRVKDELDPTTKNDLPHCQYTDEEIAKSFIEDVEAVKDLLPTTKNDLGVASELEKNSKKLDCISRVDVLNNLANIAKVKAKSDAQKSLMGRCLFMVEQMPSVTTQEPKWIPVSERLPKTDNENSINNYNVLLWVKDKNDPEDEPQIYLGKLRKVNGDDGSHNFWGIKTEPCDWTIWGWSYFHEPEVIAWMPLPKPYEPQESEEA